ncbi:MAG: hypothetical protein M1828_000104 [Chrysothrix sp. TS-e1954]|nr:MAG: hypothetical protein M1828_000104 [Chrysothrix sp. TS-e1954]
MKLINTILAFSLLFMGVISAIPATPGIASSYPRSIQARGNPVWFQSEPSLDNPAPATGEGDEGITDGGDASPAPSPSPTPAPAAPDSETEGQTSGDMTWNIVNSIGTPISMVYKSDAGAPAPRGNPTDAPLASSTQIVFPSAWAGQVTFGKGTDAAGSKIEGSLDGPDWLLNTDVSFVDGYTYPMACSCNGIPVTGCNHDLFSLNDCPDPGDGICYNPMHAVPEGPATDFFAPCAGSAYTYPNDNLADVGCTSHTWDCCIGKTCDAPVRQLSAEFT